MANSKLALTDTIMATETSSDRLNTLSDRLRYALERKQIKKSELARKIGVKHQVIQYLCDRNVKNSKFAYHIAEALNLNADWLIAGEGPFETTHAQPSNAPNAIPLLAPNQLNSLLSNHGLQASEYIYGSDDLSGAFAMHMKDQSMYPKVEEGALLIFEAKDNAPNNALVLAYLADTKDFVVRQLVLDKNQQTLNPLNIKGYKATSMSQGDKILGVVKEIRMKTHYPQ